MRIKKYRPEVFAEQFSLVRAFIRHVAYYRALNAELRKYAFPPTFWVDTANAHILQAFIHWCMVFGSYNSNKTHWHKLTPANQESLKSSFLDGVCKQLNISESEWKTYWREMIAFRDQYAAHRDMDNRKPVPFLDRALEVAFFFDSWVRDQIAPDEIDVKPLRHVFETEHASTAPAISRALEAFIVEQA